MSRAVSTTSCVVVPVVKATRGATQFYLSLEDDLMRLFGGSRMDSIGRMMEKTDMPDDMPIKASMVSKAIETAQRQVEASNFAARKHVLEYDDVMNLQRKAVYAERNAILDGKDLTDRMPEIIEDIVESHVLEWCPAKQASDDWDLDSLNKWVIQMTGIEDFTVDSIDHDDDVNVLIDGLVEYFQGLFDAKAKEIGAPFSDIESQVMLRFIDTRWMAHLQEMDYLKASIGLRAYGQRDPLTEYRDEAHRAFAALTSSIYEDYLRFLLRAPIVVRVAPQEESSPLDGKVSYSNPEKTLNEGSGVRRGAPQGGPSRLLLRRSLKLISLRPTKGQKRPLRKCWSKRPLPMRFWQEIQEVPRRKSLN